MLPKLVSLYFVFCILQGSILFGQNDIEIRGLSIKAPRSESVSRFIGFIKDELATRGVNTLVLRVDYGFKYQSHPELAEEESLSLKDAKRLLKACRAHGIQLIPQINLLGHQSWHSDLGKLLEVYPKFDETPHIKLPETYEWPNEDGLYCKSYCPLHPEIHQVIFALVDEVMEAFEATAFHAGMDEVFYIGNEKCPRCTGMNKAELFANEVSEIRNHLAGQNRELWIWGDRLLDGESTGLGLWEASMNQTHPAINMIPKDVVICDWHYQRAEPTAAYFAMKGFKVITCPWNKAEVAIAQYQGMVSFKENSNPLLSGRYAGMMQTVWSPSESFMNAMDEKLSIDDNRRGQIDCFKRLFEKLNP